MKQAILTALIAGQPETTGTAGSCSQLRKSQGSWMRDLGRESANPSAAARSGERGSQRENRAAAWENTEKAS